MLRVEHTHDGGALRLTLDAPKGNVLDRALIARVREALRACVRPEHRAIVLEGAGGHFSFGASVAEHRRDEAPSMLEALHGLFRDLAELSVPTVALVRGQCLGGGLELASYCTWLIAAPDARFGQPEIRLGVFAPMASILLPWRIGGGAALDLCVGGRTLDALEAHRIGLVSRIADDPRAAFDALYAEELGPRSASSLRFAERAVRAELHERMARHLPRLEALYTGELMQTRDANEGIEAFLERRAPEFHHR